MTRARLFVPVLLLPLCVGCESPAQPEPPATATVQFSYRSPVPAGQPPTDPLNYTGCVHHYAPNGVFSLSGSWAPNALYREPAGDCHEECRFFVSGIPIGTPEVVRVWDLGLCAADASRPPIAYENVRANGIALYRLVDHASGIRGVAFTVDAFGRVTP